MAKISKKQSLAYRMELTAWFGLVIFALGLIAQVLAFVISWAQFVKLPQLLHEHVVSFLISGCMYLLAVILPPMVAFFAGERLSKPRARYEPLYNGVLFAFLAIWLSAAFGSFTYSYMAMPLALTSAFEYLQYLPQLAALVVVIVLAYAYGKKYKHVVLHDFRPYQLLLIGSTLSVFLMGAVAFISTLQGQAIELIAIAIIGTLICVGMIMIPYIFNRDKYSLTRATHAFVAGSIGIWALAAMGTLFMFVPKLESLQSIVPSVTGLAAWVVYVYLLHRHQA